MGRIHVCDVRAGPCDDPESQLDLSPFTILNFISISFHNRINRDTCVCRVFMCEVCLSLITEGSTRLTYTVRIGEDKNTELFVYYNG